MEVSKPSMLGQLPWVQPITGEEPSLPMQDLYPGGSEHLASTGGTWEAASEQGKLSAHHLPACKS